MPKNPLPPDHGCPCCDSRVWKSEFASTRVEIFVCRNCSHRLGRHLGASPKDFDYHSQYQEGEFLISLRATRMRQADLILKAIPETGRVPRTILDFGSGRGWFLEACKTHGITQIAGADTSAQAVEILAAQGITGLKITPPERTTRRWHLGAFPFSPSIICFFDVIEHFPAMEISTWFSPLARLAQKEAPLLIIKVPRSNGFLYRLARALAKLKVSGPLEQLYQVGTFPPHFHYFSDRSLNLFLRKQGLTTVRRVLDLDFEPDAFSGRIAFLSSLRGPFSRLISRWTGQAIGALASALRMQDSVIVFCEPRPL